MGKAMGVGAGRVSSSNKGAEGRRGWGCVSEESESGSALSSASQPSGWVVISGAVGGKEARQDRAGKVGLMRRKQAVVSCEAE